MNNDQSPSDSFDRNQDKDTQKNVKKKIDLNIEAFDNKYEKYRITDKTEIEQPKPIVSINGEMISAPGGITTWSGASKAGKSAFTSFILIGVITRNVTDVIDQIPELVIIPSNGAAVVHIDTEQAKWKQQRNLITICKRAGWEECPDNFLSYNIRELDPTEILDFINGILEYARQKFGSIHLILIDGIADFVTDVNDPSASNQIIKEIEKIAVEYNCSVHLVIHTNPQSDKERGHLGSQLQRKSDSVIAVKKEGDISYLEPRFLRHAGNGDISKVQILFDKQKGYYVPAGLRIEPSKHEKENEKIRLLAKAAFSPLTALSYKESIQSIMETSGMGIATCKAYFTAMKSSEFILKGSDKRWRLNIEN